jgi:PBP1b-binding outer membrane lipoprotein LpoB
MVKAMQEQGIPDLMLKKSVQKEAEFLFLISDSSKMFCMTHNYLFRYRLISILFLFLLMASCNNPSEKPAPTTTVSEAPSTAPSEELAGLLVDAASQTLLLTVKSNGCTRKEDFKLSVQNEELVVERLQRDDCKRMPDTLQLRFSFKEAGLQANKSFRVRNRFSGSLITLN